MPSPSKNQKTRVSGEDSVIQRNNQQPVMLQKLLQSEPTISERLCASAKSGKGGEAKKFHKDKATKAIQDFEDAWRNATH
ncbi:hypothetical protein M426DRAFT_9707 [Hypoxylon sp. CI-4A]|nr:hypothetical protein M426DRAFT_9707 [Hypoxylon sp. CI-4A]